MMNCLGPRGPSYWRMVEVSAAGRAGTPDEVGNVGALLMGSDGAFITGNNFLMDGGSQRRRQDRYPRVDQPELLGFCNSRLLDTHWELLPSVACASNRQKVCSWRKGSGREIHGDYRDLPSEARFSTCRCLRHPV